MSEPLVALSSRFTVIRRLGAGGFGTVYEVRDHQRDARVALKKLERVDGAAIYRFKREFRALADVNHPNLVKLHELVSVGGEWFIIMELVEGTDFIRHVRGEPPAVGETSSIGSADTLDSDGPAVTVPDRPAAPTPAGLVEKLRAATVQLATGVYALHQLGKLHRDLKPSNVLVTPAGKVVILDFGLVTSVAELDESVVSLSVRGTPAYMAPEQAGGRGTSPASDWYSMGVMLYEALRGRLPFAGTARDMLTAKQLREPPDPRDDRPGLPDDLCDLTMALLRRDPAARPSGPDIARSLGIAVTSTPELSPTALEGSFVGRKEALEELDASYRRVLAKQAVVVHVQGSAGLGKSAVVRHFLDGLEGQATILEGRCYERENVPYKAFDGVVDALARLLERLPMSEAHALVPADAPALVRLFPAFGRVDLIRQSIARKLAVDAHELRRRACQALRGLLGALARRRPLVVVLDDLQWGDVDSAALLVELLAPPDPPPLLLIACYRKEDEATSGVLRALMSERARGAGGFIREIALPPLSDLEAMELARELLPPNAKSEVVRAVASESGGNPLFVGELARAARSASGGAPGRLTLREVISRRVAALPENARELLEVVALAGRPLDWDIARRAAGLTGRDEEYALAELRAARVLRITPVRERILVETLHNRVREVIADRLEPGAAASIHRRLARALEHARETDLEALALHLRGAGETARARGYAERAADHAISVLAFDQAVTLYRAALDPPGEHTPAVLTKLADALANAGRGPEAARAYLDARAVRPEPEALVLERKAGEQLLRSGHIDEGLAVLRKVLAAVDLDLPSGPAAALTSLVMLRLRLGVRGFEFEERPEEKVARADLDRIDVCWSVGNGLGGVELIRGAAFQARHLLLALRAGEPYRIARALAWEAILRALEGGKGPAARAADLAQTSEALAGRIGHPHAFGWAVAAAAVSAWCEADWRRASSLCQFATGFFRERCADIAWEVGSLEMWFNLSALWFLGDVKELARRAPAAAVEAEGRGDRYTATTIKTYVLPLARLAADEPDRARQEVEEAISAWSHEGWHLQHWSALLARAYADLYVGDGPSALARLDAAWKDIERTHELRIQNVRIQSLHLRGRAAVAAGQLERAEADARKLAREKHPWATAYGASVQAGVLAARQSPGASAAFKAAEAAFSGLGMELFALAARRRIAELAGESTDDLDRRIGEHGVKSPARLVDLLAPRVGVV